MIRRTPIGFLAVAGNEVLFIAGVSVLGFVLFAIRPVIQSWMIDLTPPVVEPTPVYEPPPLPMIEMSPPKIDPIPTFQPLLSTPKKPWDY